MSKILKIKMTEYIPVSSLFSHWEHELMKFKTIYDKCLTCEYLTNNECDGGCKAYKTNG